MLFQCSNGWKAFTPFSSVTRLARAGIEPARMIMLPLLMCQLPMSRQLFARPEAQIASFKVAGLDTLVSFALLLDLRYI
jgi:hypothetical protein